MSVLVFKSYVMLFTVFLRAVLLEVLIEFRSDRAEGCHFVDLEDQFKLHVSEISSWRSLGLNAWEYSHRLRQAGESQELCSRGWAILCKSSHVISSSADLAQPIGTLVWPILSQLNGNLYQITSNDGCRGKQNYLPDNWVIFVSSSHSY